MIHIYMDMRIIQKGMKEDQIKSNQIRIKCIHNQILQFHIFSYHI
jgi:hypothetical protein